jgi:hypothetical protein
MGRSFYFTIHVIILRILSSFLDQIVWFWPLAILCPLSSYMLVNILLQGHTWDIQIIKRKDLLWCTKSWQFQPMIGWSHCFVHTERHQIRTAVCGRAKFLTWGCHSGSSVPTKHGALSSNPSDDKINKLSQNLSPNMLKSKEKEEGTKVTQSPWKS